MSEKKYPRVVVGVFIFNDKDELFLMKAPCWENKYTVPGGKIEYGEKIKDAVEREIREETNMKIENIEFMGVSEGLKLGEKYKKDQKHLIFLNYKARARKTDKIKLSDEGVKYRWLKPEEWLQKDLGEFTREIIEKYLLDNESFEHRYKRALADYQNLVKRSTEERMEFIKYSNEQILLEILPVYENLKISVEHNNNNITDPWFEGVKYVLKQFKDILEKEGVEEIKTMGEKFDIHTMEAVEDNNRKEENHDKKIEEKEEKKEVDKIFSELAPTMRNNLGFMPAIDMYEDKDNVIVETQLAGIDPDKVDISIENDVLCIKGESEKKSEVEEKNYYKKEIRRGSFYRNIPLPAHVVGEKASAVAEDGVLKISIPKAIETKPKTIKIKTKKK